MGTRDRDDGHVRDVLVQEARADNPGSRFVQLGFTMSLNKAIEPGGYSQVQGRHRHRRSRRPDTGYRSVINGYPQGKLFVSSALWCVIYFVEAPQNIKGKSSRLWCVIYFVEAPQGIKGKFK